MSADKVVDFPKGEIADEEKARRVMVEVDRLVRLTPNEWKLWYRRSAASLGVTPEVLRDLIEGKLTDDKKAAREAEAEARRQEQGIERQRRASQREEECKKERKQRRIEKNAERKAKERQMVFASLIGLSTTQRKGKLIELAQRLDEDVEIVCEEFAVFAETAAQTDPSYIEPWPEPVETQALLLELVIQLQRYVVFVHDEGRIAVALWTMMSWTHAEIATHSPLLVLTSAEPDSGKSTQMGVLFFLTPRPKSAVEITGPSLFRLVDQLHPTLFIDEADKLFQRKNDLMHIVNAGWGRGVKIPRVGRGGIVQEYDLFCPKILGMKGLALPTTTVTRSIVVKLWPKLDQEKIVDFNFADNDTFVTLRRKLMRWSTDNLSALKDAAPPMPSGFVNRLAANWRLLLAIADLAGGAFPKQARAAAVKLSRKRHQPSEGFRLLEALRPIVSGREFIASAKVVRLLTADPTAEWCNFRGRGPISQQQVAALLRDYEIYSDVHHPTKKASDSQRGYLTSQFDNAFARILRVHPTPVHTQRGKLGK